MSWEIDFLNAVQHLLRNEFLDVIMPFISALGNAGIFWILLTLVLLIIPKTRKTGLASAIALLIMLVTGNMIMKPLVARLRPFTVNTAIELLIPPPLDFSFPSGHTFASFASATAIMKNNRRFGIPALILAACIAFSRLYLYVHYPTDVFFGLIFGVLAGLAGCFLANGLAPRLHISGPIQGGGFPLPYNFALPLISAGSQRKSLPAPSAAGRTFL